MIISLIGVLEAKPNTIFTEEQRAAVRFLRYDGAVACAECGRRTKSHWTMLCSFEAKTFPKGLALTLADSGKTHLPFSPVCHAHPIAPAHVPAAKVKRAAR